jgi:hypothetical protein
LSRGFRFWVGVGVVFWVGVGVGVGVGVSIRRKKKKKLPKGVRFDGQTFEICWKARRNCCILLWPYKAYEKKKEKEK